MVKDEEFLAGKGAELLSQGVPMAYIINKAWFRHLTLKVDNRVLIPRPETEVIVDEILSAVKGSSNGTVIDVCTGSGAIALSLAYEGNFDRIIATDISPEALEVARENVAAYAGLTRCNVELREGSFLEPVRGIKADVVVSNPPYIAHSEADDLPSSVRDWEPSLALFSDDNGLAATAEIVKQAADDLHENGLLALEVDSRRAQLVVDIIKKDGRYSDIVIKLDLTGRDRFVFARRV